MDNPVCASCRKGLALEEIEHGRFQHIGGRLYCAECVAKMRRVGPVPCPHCGATDTPLYTGRGYLCRKCGAEVQPHRPGAATAAVPRPRPKTPAKRCPYCGATILAEALKCRYCGSSLTREARDAEAFHRQNSQLRFWLGCLLSASVFLLLFLIYALASRRSEPAPHAVVLPQDSRTSETSKPSEVPPADPTAQLVRELREELRSVRTQLAALKAERERPAPSKEPAVVTPAAPQRTPRTVTEALKPPAPVEKDTAPAKAKVEPPTPPVAPKKETVAAKEATTPPVAPKAESAPLKAPEQIPAPTERHTTKAEVPKAEVPKAEVPKAEVTKAEVPKAEPPKAEAPKVEAPKQEERTAAQLAAAAYPVFVTELDKLRAGRRYGDALGACRQFIAAHLGTPEAEKVQAAQKALRDEIERVRDDHVRRFRQAMDKGDAEAARRVLAELAPYDAPEFREDRDRMVAELKATEAKPSLDVAKYLTQWKVEPHVARLLQELKTEKDWTVRSRAAKELGRIGHRAAIQGLLEALKDQEWYVKASAITALADIGDPIALPHLAPLTKASFPVIYDPAARACQALAAAPREKFPEAWKLVDPKAVAQEIAEALKVQDKEESSVTFRYQIALIGTLALLGAKDAAPVIRPFVERAKDPAVRKAAAAAIEKLTGEKLSLPEPSQEPPKAAPAPEPPKAAPEPPKAAPSPEPAKPAAQPPKAPEPKAEAPTKPEPPKEVPKAPEPAPKAPEPASKAPEPAPKAPPAPPAKT